MSKGIANRHSWHGVRGSRKEISALLPRTRALEAPVTRPFPPMENGGPNLPRCNFDSDFAVESWVDTLLKYVQSVAVTFAPSQAHSEAQEGGSPLWFASNKGGMEEFRKKRGAIPVCLAPSFECEERSCGQDSHGLCATHFGTLQGRRGGIPSIQSGREICR